ncbi:MAG TPA: hypothetical protein VEJ18_08175, partial [Planctomycetota bacterium]|nr:hypothetical protein [Planctomycetota bacterium]
MPTYQLECPDCDARFELRRYAPERRVRCTSCRAILVIPYAPDDPAAPKDDPPALPPELRRRLSGALALRKLGLLAALLVAVVAAGVVLVVQRRQARLAEIQAPPPPPKLTLETMPVLLHGHALPLGRGAAWEYSVDGRGAEVREVLRVTRGPEDAPEFDLHVRGSAQSGTISLRVAPHGLLLRAWSGPDGRLVFDEPPLLLPHPLYTDSRWTLAGEGRDETGAPVKWSVEYVAEASERVETPSGTFP